MKNPFSPLSPWPARLEKAAVFLATGFYSSSLPPKLAVRAKATEWGRKYLKESWTGSGLSGAVLGIITYLLLPYRIAFSLVAIALGIFFAVFVAHHAERVLGIHDDPRIVIDEWIGAWISAWGLRHHFGFEMVVAFILFRVFDVYKGPWGKRLQQLPGGWGVVLDDVAAGLIANFFARIVIVFAGVL